MGPSPSMTTFPPFLTPILIQQGTAGLGVATWEDQGKKGGEAGQARTSSRPAMFDSTGLGQADGGPLSTIPKRQKVFKLEPIAPAPLAAQGLRRFY
jgi:hypothetical protein